MFWFILCFEACCFLLTTGITCLKTRSRILYDINEWKWGPKIGLRLRGYHKEVTCGGVWSWYVLTSIVQAKLDVSHVRRGTRMKHYGEILTHVPLLLSIWFSDISRHDDVVALFADNVLFTSLFLAQILLLSNLCTLYWHDMCCTTYKAVYWSSTGISLVLAKR